MSSLARQPNRLIGRESEIADVTGLLTTSDVHLVTLTGPGGIGKTRLALDVASGFQQSGNRQVYLIEFATLRDPDLFLATIGEALGVTARIGESLRVGIEEYVQRTSVLLLLDNLEQLKGVGGDLAWLLGLTADLRILATSRSPLQVRGEHEFALAPLSGPSGADWSAVDLFVERATMANRAFVTDAAQREVIARICVRLDGLPLAIELAAARMKVITPTALESMLDHRLPILIGGELDRPDRHRTMRDAITWSFDLLSESQQRLAASISLFVGGFTLREATSLVGANDDTTETFRVLDGLSGLIDASLLNRFDGDDEPRFRMLETIRELGLDRLGLQSDVVEIRSRHAELFLALAVASRPAMRGAERTSWLDRLDLAQPNLLVALDWFVESGDVEQALQLAGSLWQFWWWRSHLLDGRKALERAIACPGSENFPALLAQCLTGMGALTETLGLYAIAAEYHERAAAIWHATGDLRGLADSYLFRWLISFNAEDQVGAETWSLRGLDLFQELNDSWGVAMALMERGVTAMRLRQHERATEFTTESISRFAELGDTWGVAINQGVQCNVETDRANRTEAATLLRNSLMTLLSLNDLWGVATVLPAAVRIAAEMGQIERAVTLSGAITALNQQIGAPLKVPFRVRFEQTLADARSRLGAVQFELAWQTGQHMTPDEAVEDAIKATVASAPANDSGMATLAIPLSPREREVLRLVPGNSARKIGEQLFISESTVRTHIDNILNKLGAKNQKELIALIYERKLI